LHGLPGCALEEIVEAGDQDETLAAGCECEAEVAEVGADNVLDLGQVRRGVQPDERAVLVEGLEDLADCGGVGGGVELQVEGGEDAARDGQQVGRELDLAGGQMKLLEHLAGVTVAEDGVGGEVVGGVHEVGVGGGGFAGSADAGLGVADDAVVEVDEAGLEERSEGEDDGGCVAAGVGDEARGADLVAMQLGAAVDGLGLQHGGLLRVGVVKFVDGAVGGLVEAPGAAEVDDADAALDGLGRPLAGLLMRCGEEEDFGAGVGDAVPAEGMDLMGFAAAGFGEVRVQVFEVSGAEFGVAGATEEAGRRCGEARMVQEQAAEFAAGVAADADDGDARCGRAGGDGFGHGCGCGVSQGSHRFLP
jgi:hypothetical protein